jgi:virginiamycin A acetyltransferase
MQIRAIIKRVKKAAALTLIAPLTLPELLARRMTGHDVWFRTQTEIIAMIPGTLGTIVRGVYYHVMLRRCPLGCDFKTGTVIGSEAEFGERVQTGRNVGIHGETTIGDDCMIASGAQIWDGKFSHGISDPSIPFREQRPARTPVRLGRNCWIGANAVVMASIGDNCVVGAGAVVTRAFPADKIILGNPARAIADTFDPRLLEGRKVAGRPSAPGPPPMKLGGGE